MYCTNSLPTELDWEDGWVGGEAFSAHWDCRCSVVSLPASAARSCSKDDSLLDEEGGEIPGSCKTGSTFSPEEDWTFKLLRSSASEPTTSAEGTLSDHSAYNQVAIGCWSYKFRFRALWEQIFMWIWDAIFEVVHVQQGKANGDTHRSSLHTLFSYFWQIR